MLKKKFSIVLLAFVFAGSFASGAVTKYDTDAAHSNIGFSMPIMGGLSHVRGKFTDFTVAIVYDDGDVTKSSVNATIKATSVDTGIERRDAHLRNADFFDVEKFPEITFASSRIEKKGKQLVAHGTFTMRGVAKEIALPFTINGVSKDPKTGKTQLGLTARTTVNRRDYGVNFSNPNNPNFLGDQVEIELNIITRAASPQP
ncbi:MAG TPA: YceI family protein [Pyrinomonadaceae bacterium]|nr:YceI family protein [Pyrinomonadaceae bacterium]